jgi:hypothetical protein
MFSRLDSLHRVVQIATCLLERGTWYLPHDFSPQNLTMYPTTLSRSSRARRFADDFEGRRTERGSPDIDTDEEGGLLPTHLRGSVVESASLYGHHNSNIEGNVACVERREGSIRGVAEPTVQKRSSRLARVA